MENNTTENRKEKFIVRRTSTEDIISMVEIWYEASILAHDFVPKTYWQENKNAMKTIYLPLSESYVATQAGKIVGFIALLNI